MKNATAVMYTAAVAGGGDGATTTTDDGRRRQTTTLYLQFHSARARASATTTITAGDRVQRDVANCAVAAGRTNGGRFYRE